MYTEIFKSDIFPLCLKESVCVFLAHGLAVRTKATLTSSPPLLLFQTHVRDTKQR